MQLLVRTYYYPGWRLYVDGVETGIGQGNNGEILITTLPGKHSYRLIYEDTLDFRVGLMISLVSFCLMTFLAFRRERTVRTAA
jgi:uncharacterized membrane protein YfhO